MTINEKSRKNDEIEFLNSDTEFYRFKLSQNDKSEIMNEIEFGNCFVDKLENGICFDNYNKLDIEKMKIEIYKHLFITNTLNRILKG